MSFSSELNWQVHSAGVRAKPISTTSLLKVSDSWSEGREGVGKWSSCVLYEQVCCLLTSIYTSDVNSVFERPPDPWLLRCLLRQQGMGCLAAAPKQDLSWRKNSAPFVQHVNKRQACPNPTEQLIRLKDLNKQFYSIIFWPTRGCPTVRELFILQNQMDLTCLRWQSVYVYWVHSNQCAQE